MNILTGNKQQKRNFPSLFPDSRVILKNLESLNNRDRKIVFNLIKSLKEIEDFEKE